MIIIPKYIFSDIAKKFAEEVKDSDTATFWYFYTNMADSDAERQEYKVIYTKVFTANDKPLSVKAVVYHEANSITCSTNFKAFGGSDFAISDVRFHEIFKDANLRVDNLLFLGSFLIAGNCDYMFSNLNLRGTFTIPPYFGDENTSLNHFLENTEITQLYNAIATKGKYSYDLTKVSCVDMLKGLKLNMFGNNTFLDVFKVSEYREPYLEGIRKVSEAFEDLEVHRLFDIKSVLSSLPFVEIDVNFKFDILTLDGGVAVCPMYFDKEDFVHISSLLISVTELQKQIMNRGVLNRGLHKIKRIKDFEVKFLRANTMYDLQTSGDLFNLYLRRKLLKDSTKSILSARLFKDNDISYEGDIDLASIIPIEVTDLCFTRDKYNSTNKLNNIMSDFTGDNICYCFRECFRRENYSSLNRDMVGIFCIIAYHTADICYQGIITYLIPLEEWYNSQLYLE